MIPPCLHVVGEREPLAFASWLLPRRSGWRQLLFFAAVVALLAVLG